MLNIKNNMIQKNKEGKTGFRLLDIVVKKLRKTKIHKKIPFVKQIYQKLWKFVYNLSQPKRGLSLIKVQGNNMYVNMADKGLTPALVTMGVYEPTETKLFKKIVKEGMVVLDLGANIGYYTLIAARIVGGKGKVYAFEPESDNYKLLLKNIEVNGFNNVIPIQKAATNNNGKIDFFKNNVNFGSHSICNLENTEKTTVDTVKIDDFLNEKVDVIKMDIEGGEFLALEGMKKVIEKSKEVTLFTEFNPTLIKNTNKDPNEFIAILKRAGFEIFFINTETEELEGLNMAKIFEKHKSGMTINLLCKKK